MMTTMKRDIADTQLLQSVIDDAVLDDVDDEGEEDETLPSEVRSSQKKHSATVLAKMQRMQLSPSSPKSPRSPRSPKSPKSPRKKATVEFEFQNSSTVDSSAPRKSLKNGVKKVMAVSQLIRKRTGEEVEPQKPPTDHLALGKSFKTGVKKAIAISHLKQAQRERDATSLADQLMIEDMLVRLPMFASCSEEFVHDVALNCAMRVFVDGNIIATKGTEGMSIVMVLDGCLHAHLGDDKVSSFVQGQVFGETILLGVETHWTATLVVSGSCIIAELTKDGFRHALVKHIVERKYFEQVRLQNSSHASEGTLVNRCIIFRGFADETMADIDSNLMRRLYFPGQKFLTEGEEGDELYVLVRGTARVTIANRLIRLERRNRDGYEECYKDGHTCPDGGRAERRKSIEEKKRTGVKPHLGILEEDELVCFGELGLLGLQERRSATVAADSVCHLRVLHRSVFLRILESHGESVRLSQLMQFFQDRYKDQKAGGSSVIEVLQNVPLFVEVGCGLNFLKFLAKHLEDRIFLQGQKIIDENNSDDRCMYIIGRGSAEVQQAGKKVATVSAGSVVGEIIVLGLAAKRNATVVAEENCHMHVLHQSVVVRGLELYPEERSKVLLMALQHQQGLGQPAGLPQDVMPGSRRVMIQALKQSEVLSDVSDEFIEEVGKVAEDRIYMPGDVILEQGAKGESMVIMVSGTATVYVLAASSCDDEDSLRAGEVIKKFGKHSMSKVGTLHRGSVAGELAMLGVAQYRSATIEAETICSMWEISQEDAMGIIARFPKVQDYFADVIIEHLERTVPQRLSTLALFKGFDQKFRTLLCLYCERTTYFPDQQIVREGQNNERLYVINSGRCRLEKKGINVKMYPSGSYFGCTVMLGIHKVYIGTLSAFQTCHILAISRAAYMSAIDQYPSVEAVKAMKKTEKIKSDQLREAVVRTATRKLIYQRYQSMFLESSTTPHMPGEEQLTEEETLQRFIQAWLQRVKDLQAKRNQLQMEHNDRQDKLDRWVSKRDQQMQSARLRREMQYHPAIDIDMMQADVGGKGDLRLPPIKQQLADDNMISGVLQAWPTPRPSPHYRLRVYGVLRNFASSQGGAVVLPLIKNDSGKIGASTTGVRESHSTEVAETSDSGGSSDCSELH